MFDSTPYKLLIILSLMLGFAPFYPAPHLYEKMVMLITGAPFSPMDIGDIFFHGAPAAFLLAKVLNDYVIKKN